VLQPTVSRSFWYAQTISRISGNPSRVIIGFVGNILRMDEAQRAQHPMLDVISAGMSLVNRQLACLLKCESHSRQLHCRAKSFCP